MTSTNPANPQPPSGASSALAPWLIGIGVLIVIASAVAVPGGNVLLVLAIAVGFLAIVAATYAIVVRLSNRQLARLQARAPGQLVFRFQSNSWFKMRLFSFANSS